MSFIFDSAIEAVESAIELQKILRDEPKIPLRIGIHNPALGGGNRVN